MEYVTSTEARNNFAAIVEMAKREPVIVQKQGREEAVILSPEKYRELNGDPVQRFHALAKRMRENAKRRGLTKKIFDEIMAEK